VDVYVVVYVVVDVNVVAVVVVAVDGNRIVQAHDSDSD